MKETSFIAHGGPPLRPHYAASRRTPAANWKIRDIKTVRSPEIPALHPGETWYPRGQGLERTIVGIKPGVAGEALITYRTRHGEFTTTARDFRVWIDHLSASPPR